MIYRGRSEAAGRESRAFFVSGWRYRDRPKANLRKFRGYSSDCQNQKYEAISEGFVAGGPGFEPRLTESESAVLPLRAHEKPGREDRGAPCRGRLRSTPPCDSAPRHPLYQHRLIGRTVKNDGANAATGALWTLRYLSAYASEMAWREDSRRVSNGEQYLMATNAALKHGVSRQWKGYWQS